MVWRLLVAEPALVPRRTHLLLVAEPLHVLGRDVHPRRFRRGRWWMWGFGGHEAIVSVLGGKFRPAPTWLRSFLGGRAVLMPSTPFAYSDVISRRFAYFRVIGFDISAGQCNFCDGFDSRQLHEESAGQDHKSWPVFIRINISSVMKIGDPAVIHPVTRPADLV